MNQILSLTCLPIPPNEHFIVLQFIPQFDFSTISIVLFSSIFSVAVYYFFISVKLLPEIITILKFRTKRLDLNNSSKLSEVFLPNFFSYNFVLKFK